MTTKSYPELRQAKQPKLTLLRLITTFLTANVMWHSSGIHCKDCPHWRQLVTLLEPLQRLSRHYRTERTINKSCHTDDSLLWYLCNIYEMVGYFVGLQNLVRTQPSKIKEYGIRAEWCWIWFLSRQKYLMALNWCSFLHLRLHFVVWPEYVYFLFFIHAFKHTLHWSMNRLH